MIGCKSYADFRSPDEFSIGVEILFVILSIISLFSVFLNNYYIGYVLLFTVTAHFIIRGVYILFTVLELILSCVVGAAFIFVIFGVLKKSEKHYVKTPHSQYN